MLKFDFLDKGLGIVFPAHFVYDFSTKMFFMLYSINRPNFTVWLPFPADKLTSQRRRKNVLILVLKTSKIGLKSKSRRPFFKTSPRRLPEDVLKTSLKTSSRPFLVKAKENQKTIYRLFIYYILNYITTSLEKLIAWTWINTLKHGNNAEIVKTSFSMKCETRKYFFQELKYVFSIGVSHTVALLGLLLLKFEKRFRKGCYNKETLTFV